MIDYLQGVHELIKSLGGQGWVTLTLAEGFHQTGSDTIVTVAHAGITQIIIVC